MNRGDVVLGTLSLGMKQKLNECLKAGLGLR